jgi:hypothetical protein
MRKALGGSKVLALVVFCVGVAACRAQPKDSGLGAPRVIDCASQAVTNRAPELLGPINGCLAAEGSIDACLLSLVQPGIGVGIDAVMCLTRREGSTANAASQANPDDALDRRKAQRARAFLEGMAQRGLTLGD